MAYVGILCPKASPQPSQSARLGTKFLVVIVYHRVFVFDIGASVKTMSRLDYGAHMPACKTLLIDLQTLWGSAI